MFSQPIYSYSKSPFRMLIDVPPPIIPITGSIEITFNNHFTVPNGGPPICTLIDQTVSGIPFLTQCSYDPGTKTYTLKPTKPIDSARYLMEISSFQQDLCPEGLVFPTGIVQNRFYVKVKLKSDSSIEISEDSTTIATHPRILILNLYFY